MPPVLNPETQHKNSVYGPVKSWRLGQSLGVDLLLETSICSFNCIYCQLGDIQNKTIERKIYVETDQIERDFKNSNWQHADVITLSGSGEPTLALNLGEVIYMLKEYSDKSVMVLTNGTTLKYSAVRQDLKLADTVSIKLDAGSEEVFQRMNRPVPGVTLDSVIKGAEAFRKEYTGKLCLQCMFMPGNLFEAEAIAEIASRIQPDEIQLNTPKRPYPQGWFPETRGSHDRTDFPAKTLRVVSSEEAQQLQAIFSQRTNAQLVSVYREED